MAEPGLLSRQNSPVPQASLAFSAKHFDFVSVHTWGCKVSIRDIGSLRHRGQKRLRWCIVFGGFVLLAYTTLVWFHSDQAKLRMKERDLEAASGWLARLTYLLPYSSQVAFLRARHARLQGNLMEMFKQLEHAKTLGMSLETLQKEEVLAHVQSGELNNYELTARRFLVEPGDDAAEICEAIINGLLLNYRLAEASQLLELWEKDFPGDAQPIAVRANVTEQIGQTHRAIELYQRAVELAPQRKDIKRRLFISLVSQHRYREAELLLKTWTYHSDRDVNFNIALATFRLETGNAPDALELLEQLGETHHEHRQVQLLLARQLFREGQVERVLSIVRSYLERSPRDYDFRYLLGQALSSRGDPEAKVHLDFVSEADKELEKMHLALDQAKEKPKDPASHYEIGKSLLDYGYRTQGLGWLRSTLELDPHHRGAMALLAEYYEQEKQPTMARKYRESLSAENN